MYDIQAHYKVPISSKAGLLNFISESWEREEEVETEINTPLKLYLGGGFSEETKSVLLTNGNVIDVPELQSSQEEADTSMFLPAMFTFTHDEVKRIIIHANDTDVIVRAIFYMGTLLSELPEFWIRTEKNKYIQIHEVFKALGEKRCKS